MDPRLNIVTLGVRDLARAVHFYRDGLGWRPAVELGDFVLFDMGGAALALYPRDLLAEDAGVPPPGPRALGGVTLAQNVASREEVDRVITSACAAGATLLRRASEKERGGYSGYFADPDGYPWEIAFNPHFRLDDRGRLVF
jgi:catechol 2,3-dioxygenase-like lactoylglutathione lyase family enzyme